MTTPDLDLLFNPRHISILDSTFATHTTGQKILQTQQAQQSAIQIELHQVDLDAPDWDQAPLVHEKTQLAVIVAHLDHQHQLVHYCDRMRVPACLLITPNYEEPALLDLPPSLANITSTTSTTRNMQILGPQSFGLIRPHHGVNLTLNQPMPRPGNIALLTQNASLSTTVLDWSANTNLGFSAVTACGAAAAIDWHQLITHFGDDPYTKSIVIHLENITETRPFLSACKEVALTKPIILLKAGRTMLGATVAGSHSYGDPQADLVLDAALKRVGVLRVHRIADLFHMARILGTQPLPKGPRLTIVSNALSPSVLATDTLLSYGGELATLSDATTEQLSQILPAGDDPANPVNLEGDATPQRYLNTLQTTLNDKETDGHLVLLTPYDHIDPTVTARNIIEVARKTGKPILTSWMGNLRVQEGQQLLHAANIPSFPHADTPARLFGLMWQQTQNLENIYQTPTNMIDERENPIDRPTATTLIQNAHDKRTGQLTEWEAKAVLRAYGLPVTHTLPATTADEALTCAQVLGYPVLLKLLTPTPHLKTKVHGVRLALHSPGEVRKAYESIQATIPPEETFTGVTVQRMISTAGLRLIVGSRVDPHFGPYLYFGTGGKMTHILRDHALGLPPLTTTLAQQLISQTKAWLSIQEHSPQLLHQLQSLLVRISQLVIHHPQIQQLTINPLLMTTTDLTILDATMTLAPPNEPLPRPAIRPYPTQYIWPVLTRRQQPLLIRPIKPEDEPLIIEFHKKLSEETIYRRYFFHHKLSRRTSHQRLRRTCFLDFDREIALGAYMEETDTNGATQTVVTAVGRLTRSPRGNSAEISLLVADPYQGNGIGTFILKYLIQIAREEKIPLLHGTMLPGNIHMQHLFHKHDFTVTTNHNDDTVKATRLLDL